MELKWLQMRTEVTPVLTACCTVTTKPPVPPVISRLRLLEWKVISFFLPPFVIYSILMKADHKASRLLTRRPWRVFYISPLHRGSLACLFKRRYVPGSCTPSPSVLVYCAMRRAPLLSSWSLLRLAANTLLGISTLCVWRPQRPPPPGPGRCLCPLEDYLSRESGLRA